jgi:hypothetical protein
LYWQLSLPYSRQLSDDLWFYTAPGWGSSYLASAQYLPVGLSYEVDDQIRAHAEIGAELHLLDAAERDHALVYGGVGVSITP